MPGQYKHLAPHLAADKNNEVVFLTKPKPKINLPNVKKIEYQVNRDSKKHIHKYLIGFERGIFAGQEAWRVCNQLKQKGFTPDIIIAHSGWGDGLFLKDIYPNTPILSFMEYFYNGYGEEASFDKSEPNTPDDCARLRIRNAMHLVNLNAADYCITPTKFQFSKFPKEYHNKFTILHEGIDTNKCKPARHKAYDLPNGQKLQPGKDEIVTYIARNLEPYRGFAKFMQSVELLQKQRPNAHFIIIGGDDVSYGNKPEQYKTWREQMLAQTKTDESRVHFMGYVNYDIYLKTLQVSDVHVYLTYPFVLSWSLMEAMAVGCSLVVSDTTPVHEMVQDGKTGLHADFSSPQDIASKVIELLDNKTKAAKLGAAASQFINDNYSLDKLLPKHVELIKKIVNEPNRHSN